MDHQVFLEVQDDCIRGELTIFEYRYQAKRCHQRQLHNYQNFYRSQQRIELIHIAEKQGCTISHRF